MNENTKVSPQGSDWTRLLTDPELVSHLPRLLQTYREVPPEQREAALLQVMRDIKDAAAKQRQGDGDHSVGENKTREDTIGEGVAGESKDLETPAGPSVHETVESKTDECKSNDNDDDGNRDTGSANAHAGQGIDPGEDQGEDQTEVHRETLTLTAKATPEQVAPPAPPDELHRPEPVTEVPPFETDPLSDLTAEDRRRFHRIKCYVAVEINIEGVEAPVWGNLANVSRGGCLVETASAVPPGKALEIGLWVASGKIWVKGVILTGVAQRSASFGVRVKFSEAELSEKQHLRDFLKFIEGSARKSHSGNAYLAQLKT
jgi:hypothetical protein